MSCNSCGKHVSENEVYIYKDKCMCENCAMKAGLYPLGHTGSRRDKISKEGRRLTVPKPDER
jgi:hypothetical protein